MDTIATSDLRAFEATHKYLETRYPQILETIAESVRRRVEGGAEPGRKEFATDFAARKSAAA